MEISQIENDMNSLTINLGSNQEQLKDILYDIETLKRVLNEKEEEIKILKIELQKINEYHDEISKEN